MKTLEERFWDKVRKGPGCWEWVGCKGSHGYGYLGDQGETLYAHRVSWTLANGDSAEGLCVCHKCDNPGCVRPSHLFLGTQADNHRDRNQKGRHAYGERHGSRPKPERMPRGERHGNAKMTAEKVVRLRQQHKNGASQLQLAADYGIRQSSVWAIVHRKAWKHV